jgi:hypothetical protein
MLAVAIGAIIFAGWHFTLAACSATPSHTAQTCIERYQGCGLTAPDMTTYVKCRDAVDVGCLPQKDAGAP